MLESVQTIGAKTILGLPLLIKNTIVLNSVDLPTIKDCIRVHAAEMFHNTEKSQFNHKKKEFNEQNLLPQISETQPNLDFYFGLQSINR